MTFDDLERSIGFTFKSKALLKHAFIHRSYLNEDKSVPSSNERLEFLGDSVLALLTSDFLFRAYPDFPEGKLTNVRSSLVNTKTLGSIAQTLGLGELLFVSRGELESGGRSNLSLLADVFEALLGALYLDQGLDTAKKFLEKVLFIRAHDIVKSNAYTDYKSLLQEKIQEKQRISPTYHVIKSEGPDHAKTFYIEVRVGTKILGDGVGKSKQEAEQSAAHAALEQKDQI